MNYQLATYIDFIQSIGLITLATISLLVVNKIVMTHKKENEIHPVKITVEK